MNDEYESPPPPKVTGSPERIWLVYGELEHDDTHAAICRDGEVTWCEDSQFDTDQEYIRADIHRAAIAAHEAGRQLDADEQSVMQSALRKSGKCVNEAEQAAVAAERRVAQMALTVSDAYEKRISELEAAQAQDRQDAERYRWLRDSAEHFTKDCDGATLQWQCWFDFPDATAKAPAATTFDAAIDAAMREQT